MKTIITLYYLSLAYCGISQNLTQGLQACYPLDMNANNTAPTGSSLSGTLVSATSATAHPGVGGSSYYLQGNTGSYIELPDHAGLKSDSVFFSGWFRPDSLPFVQYLVYTYNGCSSNFEAYSLTIHDDFAAGGHVFCVTKSPANCFSKPQITSTVTIVPGTWYHVCFYIDNSVMKLYVNGVLQSSASHAVTFAYQSGLSVFLGVTNQSNFNKPFKGAIDNVRFYNRELTQQEINLLYTQDPACDVSGSMVPVTTYSASRTIICKGESISFTDLSSNNPNSWSWQFSGGVPATSTLQNPVVTFPGSGVYTVSLVAGNASGSGSTSVITVTVNNCTSLSEDAYTGGGLHIYPNPAADRFFITNLGNHSFIITDPLGRLVNYTRKELDEQTSEVYLPDAAAGLYLLKVTGKGDRCVWTKRISLAR